MTDKTEASAEGEGQSFGPPPIIENLFGAEVYADDAAFFSLKLGNVSMTLVSSRFDANDGGKLKLVTIGRLIMPAGGAQRLVMGLYNYLAENGLAPKTTDPEKAN